MGFIGLSLQRKKWNSIEYTVEGLNPPVHLLQPANQIIELMLHWSRNGRVYEAEIAVPKGTVLNIGEVAPQKIESTGTILKGEADQILMPRDWPNTWIKNMRIIPSK